MDLRRLSPGDFIAAAAAVLMLVALFLPWYSVNGADQSAWQAMAVDDVLLAVAAVGALVAVVAVATPRMGGASVAAVTLAGLPSIVAVLLVLVRLASPAPEGDASLAVGAWLGLVAALGITGGLWAASHDEGPARRSAAAERAAARHALEGTDLLELRSTGEGTPRGATPSG